MPTHDAAISLRTLDGLRLAGILTAPGGATSRAVVLVHGGGVTREEGGLFTRLAASLAEAGVASLRFDLRGHGESEGRQEETTLAGHLNDIGVTLACAVGDRRVRVVSAGHQLRRWPSDVLRGEAIGRAVPPGVTQPAA